MTARYTDAQLALHKVPKYGREVMDRPFQRHVQLRRVSVVVEALTAKKRMMATRETTKPTRGAANIVGVWREVLLRIYELTLGQFSLLSHLSGNGKKGRERGKKKEKKRERETHMGDFAADQARDVGERHENTSHQQGDSRSQIEGCRPNRQPTGLGHGGCIVHRKGISGEAKDSQAA